MENNVYYEFEQDLNEHPEAVIFVVVGGRATGKTYSTLKYLYKNHIVFGFVKRTNNDVDILCSASEMARKKNIDVELSPFKPLNRDFGWNVRPVKLMEGIGAFFNCDEENHPIGAPVGYILSLHAIKNVKGFSMDECDYIVFDEFVPNMYERVDRNEHIQLLDLHKTLERDKFLKGKQQRIVCLANAADLTCPMLTGIDIVNELADMQINDESQRFLDDRLIYIHRLNDNPEFFEKESQNPIYKVMKGTPWARMSLNNEFAYNDLSNVKKKNLKNHIPVVGVIYKEHKWYIYNRDGHFHMCATPNGHCEMFDLNKENDQKRFFNEWQWELRDICIDNRMTFQSFQMYDLIVNYKKIFKV